MRKIALEEHFTTLELCAYALDGAYSSMDREIIGPFEKRLCEFDAMRLEAMDRAEIDRAVLAVTSPGIQGEHDGPTAIRRACEANDFLVREMQKHPERYAGFAHLPL